MEHALHRAAWLALILFLCYSPAQAQIDSLPRERSAHIRLGFGATLPFSPTFRDVFIDNGYHDDELATVEEPVRHGNGIFATFDYPVAGRFSAGFAWLTLGRVAGQNSSMQGRRPETVMLGDELPLVQTTTGLREIHTNSSYYMLAAYHLLRARDTGSGIESFLGAGAGAADVSLEYWLVDRQGDAYLGSRIYRPLSFSALLFGTVEYSIVDGFALDIFAACQYIPSVEMPSIRIKGEVVTDPTGTSAVVYSTLNPYRVNFSALRIGVCARFDFIGL